MSVERIQVESRQHWLDLRRQDVTASDIATVCGVSPWKSAMQLWAEKTGIAGEAQENALMRRGRWYEPAVIRAAMDCTTWASITPLENKIYLRDPEARIGATPDAIATNQDGEFIVQLKVTERRAFETWEGQAPLAYQLQTLTEAMLWGASRAVLAVLINEPFGAEFVTFDVPRHAGVEAKIKAAVQRFWSDIEAGRHPQADYAVDGDLLRALYPPREGVEPIDLSSDNLLTAILDERAMLKAVNKQNDNRLAEIEAEIVDKLQGASIGLCNGWRLSHQITHRKEYTVPEKSFPVLRISRTKDAQM